MRHSLLHATGRVHMATLRHKGSHSFHSAAKGWSLVAEDSSMRQVFARQHEFARRRAMYFSSSAVDSDIRNRILGNHSSDKQRKRQHREHHEKKASTSPIMGSMYPSNCFVQDERDENLLQPVFSSIKIGKRHRWYSTKSTDGTISTIDLVSPPALASKSKTSAPMLGPLKRSKITMAGNTESKDDNEAEGENIHTADDIHSTSESSNGDESNKNAPSNDGYSEDWKRVRTIKVPQYGQDAEKAFRSLQIARKERARVKTSINVQRALYGNMLICAAKLGAWMSSGSSSMMSEFVHSVVDCGNQALLLVGLRDTRNAADKRHPYGYGKSVYFWALVSALGTFFMGAGVSMSHSVQSLFHPSLTETISNEVWFVLAMSFSIDGYVFYKTFLEMEEGRPKGVPILKYMAKLRDPATLAVLMEDGAACLGIVIAIAGIAASHATCNPIYDGVAGVGISCLLAGVGMALVRVNHSFLIGQSVDKDMLEGIEKIIRNRRSIENVSGIQSQWTGPETFSYKAEVDFDGTYLSALLMPRYRAEFHKAGDDLDEELEVLLSWYAEDVIRAVEREVRHIEAMIRQQYPGAEYIELEPMSKYVDRFAIDDSFEEKLLMIEKKELKKWVRVLYENKEENAWRFVDTSGDTQNNDTTVSENNVVSGSLPSDTMSKSVSSSPPPSSGDQHVK